MKCFIDNQDMGLVGDWVIPSSGPRHNWCICEGFDGFIAGMHIHVFSGELEDCKIVAKAARICIGISLVGGFSPRARLGCSTSWRIG